MTAPDERDASLTPMALDAAPMLPLPIIAMAHFRRLMASEGYVVDLARMCVDRQYVFECLAQAQSSAEERLRRAALYLFATYDRHLAPGLAH